MADPLAYQFEIEVAGRQLFFERTLDLLRRLESVVGPVRSFAERLDRGAVESAEVTRVYAALVRDDPDGPTTEQIDSWVFRKGLLCHQKTAAFLYSLIVGSDALEREAKRLAALERDAGRKPEGGRGPF